MLKNSKTKRFLSVVLSVALIFTLLTSMWIYSASAETGSDTYDSVSATAAEPTEPDLDGKGTEEEPFLIANKSDMEIMRDHINAMEKYIVDGTEKAYAEAYYELTADVDLQGGDGNNWDPIGRSSDGFSTGVYFAGVFDGKGHTVSGLYIDTTSRSTRYYCAGLFGYNTGTIKNLIVSGNLRVDLWNGMIAGRNVGTIENCAVNGILRGAANTGAIVGVNRGGTIKNCYSTITSFGIYGASYSDSEKSKDPEVKNNYYLASNSVKDNIAGSVEPVTQEDLASGKVAWLLQNGVEDGTIVWGQNLEGKETVPALYTAEDNYTVHRVQFHFYDTDEVVAEAYVNNNKTVEKPDVTVDVNGYNVGDKWFNDKDKVNGDDDAWEFTSGVTADTDLYSSREAIKYTITYNLGDNANWGDKESDDTGHPATYTVESNAITLDEPVREGYKFVGWTGTGITGSAESVTIETGSTGDRVYNAQYYDNENPTASIEVGGDKWTYLDSYIEFDTFFNTSQTVTITAEDNDDDSVEIWYYITNSPVEDITSAEIEWTVYDGANAPVIDPEGQYVIYAKAQDDAGHIGYTSTSGIVLEITPPVISGLTERATYCESVTFTVEDEYLDTVIDGNNTLTAAEDGKTFTITGTGSYIVIATDKAGNTTSVYIDIADHTPGEPQTEVIREVGCETDGENLISTYCTNCSALLSRHTETIEHQGHQWDQGREIKPSLCDSTGEIQYTCEKCGFIRTDITDATGHSWGSKKVTITTATCQREGQRAYRCENCDATKEEEVIAKLPHNSARSSQENRVEATCTTDGGYDLVIRCSMCKEVQKITHNILPSPGHMFSEWETIVAQDCDDSGVKQRTCSVCGTNETRNINPNGHTWKSVVETDKEPTCTVDGSQSIHCEICGVSDPDTIETLPAKGHTPAEGKITLDYTPATCEVNGGYYEVTLCEVCKEEVTRTYVVLYAQGHDMGDWYSFTSEVCGGDTGERRDCKNCTYSETRDVNKLAHDWNVDAHGEYIYTVDLEPSCTTQGSQSVHCKRSGCVAILASETIDPLGHDWSDWSVVESPDCDDSGTEMRTCKRCEASETNGLNPSGHDWNVDENGNGIYTVDAAASCTTDGSQSIHCKKCDARINSQVIPAYGHTFGEWTIITSPDCDDEGTMQRTCSECHYVESENINATGHDWEDDFTIDLPASCTTDGSMSIHCSICGAKKDSTVIPMLNHTWGPWETVEMPDCNDEGTQQRVCEICGAIDTLGLVPSGHEVPVDENGETVYTIVEATCTTDGSKSVLCKRCGVALESEVIPALGHDYVEGVCSRCGATDGTAAAPEIDCAEHVIGSGENASINCSIDLKWFISVSVDGKIVDAKYYTTSGEDSTVITFTSEFLDTLEAGEHNVVLSFTYIDVATTLTIIEIPEETTYPESTTDPIETTTQPEESTDPDETTTQPEESTAPGETTTQPEASTDPDETTTQPEASTDPDETTTQPEASTVPGETTTQPEEPTVPGETTTQPKESTDPGETTTQPEESTAPGETTTQPGDEPTTQAPEDEPTTKPSDEPTSKPADEVDLEIVLSVTDNEHVISSGKTATIYCNGPLDKFVKVLVDGNVVDESCYSLKEGSTILTFTAEYLDTLAVGEHDVTLVYTYDKVSTVLNIIEETSVDEPTTQTPADETTADEPTTQTPAEDSTVDETATQAPGSGNSTSPETGNARYIAGISSAILFAAAGVAFVYAKKRKEDEE